MNKIVGCPAQSLLHFGHGQQGYIQPHSMVALAGLYALLIRMLYPGYLSDAQSGTFASLAIALDFRCAGCKVTLVVALLLAKVV
jgi:hypothetical protein